MTRHIDPRPILWRGCLAGINRVGLLASILLLSTTTIAAHPRWRVLESAQSLRVLRTSGQGESVARILVPGTLVEQQIAGEEVHSYSIMLTSGQYVSVVVDQQSVDVSIKIFGPDGRRLGEVNGVSGLQELEQVSLVAELDGNYRLEVSPARKQAARGRYNVKVEELRVATAEDRSLVAAETLFAQARSLRRQNTEESLRGAVTKYEEALRLYRAAGERRREVNTLNALGDIYRNMGDDRKALNLFTEALSISRSVDDRPLQITTLIYLGGGIYFDLAEPEKALDHLAQALNLSLAAGDRQAQATVHNNFGAIYTTIDEPQRALEHYNQAMAIYQATGNTRGKSMTLANLGFTYHALGEYEQALASYQGMLSIVQSAKYSPGIAAALQNLGGTYIAMGQPRESLGVLDEALTLARSTGYRMLEAQTLAALGAAHHDLGETKRAREMYALALSINREIGLRREEAIVLYEIGAVNAAAGEKEKAREYYNQALPLSRSIKSRTIEALALYGIARIERDLGRLDDARAHIEAALDLTESQRTKVTSHDLRSSFLASKQNFYELYIETLMLLHQRQPSEGYGAVALEAAEKARARSLLEMLAEARIDVREGVDAQLLERERNLKRRINAKAERHAQLLGSKSNGDQAALAGKELDSLLEEDQQVQAQIRASSPRYSALTQPQPLGAGDIQRQLDQNTLLLEYSLGDERSFLWAVTPDSVTSYVLPKREEIEQAARRFYELLTTRNHRSEDENPGQRASRVEGVEPAYNEAALALSRMLLGPVADMLGAKRLIIVGEGTLQYVPFSALPAPMAENRGRRVRDRANHSTSPNPQPLIVDHEIVNLPSASVLAVLRRESTGRPQAPKAVAVLADPVFRSDDPRIGDAAKERRGTTSGDVLPQNLAISASPSAADAEGSAKESGVTAFKRLRFSRQEAEAITSLCARENLEGDRFRR